LPSREKNDYVQVSSYSLAAGVFHTCFGQSSGRLSFSALRPGHATGHCGYCDKTNKEAFSDPTLRDKYISHYVLAYVDAESGRRLRLPSGERITERELGTRYNAAVTPVFSFMTPDGTLVLRLVGLQEKASLLAADRKIQEALAGVSTQ
jgi:hypothetical protein